MTNAASVAVTVTLKEAAPLVLACANRKKPVMLWGGTGVGKSDLMEQLAAALGLPLHTFIASLKTPVDLSGIPVPDLATGTTTWLRSEDIPTFACVLFLDEINTCPPSMQAALFQLALKRCVGQHKLHPDTIIVAAGNRLTDRAAAQRMPTALANRFQHFNVEPAVEDWCEYQAGRGISPLYSAFLRFRPELIYLAPGQESERVKIDASAVAFPTPRSHETAAGYIDVADAMTRFHLIASAVGEGVAHEIEGFLRLTKDLPTFTEVSTDPKHARVPADPAAKYAVASMIASQATKETVDAVFAYAARLGGEFEMLAASEISRRSPELTETGAYTTFAIANQNEVL
jgi:hypothetical protein